MIIHNAKINSAVVAKIPKGEIKISGINGFINCVYSKKLFQFPQAETSLLQNPNLSAIADKNPNDIATLKNNLTCFLHFFNLF